ncbi:MAG: metallophosphoesterase [Actinomycetota bacterium]|nr:metallophosphoesterase [Actinomycetota bacterium]
MTATVLQLSDTHLRAWPGGQVSGADPDRRLKAVLDAWQAVGQRADLVVVSGDETDDGSATAYARLAEALDPLDAPIMALAGNHDRPDVMAARFGRSTTAEVGAWRIVGLDSSRPEQVHGTVEVPAALAVLDALDDRPTVVGIHHPPLSRSSHPWFRLDGATELLEGLGVRSHVRAVISGHVHDLFDFEGPGGTALLGCPSTLMAMAHDGDHYERCVGGTTGARVLYLGDDGTMASTVLVA